MSMKCPIWSINTKTTSNRTVSGWIEVLRRVSGASKPDSLAAKGLQQVGLAGCQCRIHCTTVIPRHALTWSETVLKSCLQ